MRRSRRNYLEHVDWVLVGLFLVLIVIGWVNIYAASYQEDYPSIFSFSQNYGKQFIWMLSSVAIAWLMLVMDSRFFETFSFPIYAAMMLLLAGVLVFGSEIKGAQSWYTFGGFSLQPSEFGKFASALAVARLLTMNENRTREFLSTVKALAIIALPAILILLQPDTGSTLVFGSFIFVLYREGLSGNVLLGGLLLIVLFVLSLLFELNQLLLAFCILATLAYSGIYASWRFLLTAVGLLVLLFIGYYQFQFEEIFLLGGVLGLSIALIIYNFTQREMKNRGARNGAIGLFVVAMGFIYTVGFIFNNVLQEHQRTRITVLLGEEDKLSEQIATLKTRYQELPASSEIRSQIKSDLASKKESLDKLRKGAGWNVNQSKIAIGSGGLIGKGFLDGTQTKFNFVPEQSTDFIFCTVGEEWGFLGSTVVVALFVWFLVRLIVVAERQRSRFSRIYGYSVASIFFFHFAINIAMTLGLAPVIGIPLPFFSYGGSSLWAFTILLFIFVKLDSERKYVLG